MNGPLNTGPLNTGPRSPVLGPPDWTNPALPDSSEMLSESKGVLSDSKGAMQKVPDPMLHSSGASVPQSHSILGNSGKWLFPPVSADISEFRQHFFWSVPSQALPDSVKGASVPLPDSSLNASDAVTVPRPRPSGEGFSDSVEVKASRNRLRKRMRISLLNAFISQKIFQQHPGESFEAVYADGNLVPSVKPHFVWHLRLLGMYVTLALPFTISLIAETIFVAPGFTEYCNLGQENCELEWTLSMILCIFLAMIVTVPKQVVANQKHMNFRAVLFVYVRHGFPTLCWQVLLYNLLPIILDKRKEELILIFAAFVRAPSTQIVETDKEGARSLLGYDDWWDFRKRNEDPDDPETAQEKKGERLKRVVKVMNGLVAGNLIICVWILLDLVFISHGTWGTLLQTLRPMIFFALKRIGYLSYVWCQNNLEGPDENIGYVRQYIGPWIQIVSGVGTCLTAMNCLDWQGFASFWVCDMVAFGNRVFVFSDVGENNVWLAKYRESMKWGKPKTVGKMKQRELLGYDLIMEGVTLQVSYMMLLLFAPYTYFVLGEDHLMTKFWFPYENSLLFLVILSVSDFIQDFFLMKYVMRKTDCSYSFFFGREFFSYANLQFAWSLSTMSILIGQICHLAYAFKQDKIGVFADKDA